jgi:uncharacterized membrane protein YbaN (DUF454 family)
MCCCQWGNNQTVADRILEQESDSLSFQPVPIFKVRSVVQSNKSLSMHHKVIYLVIAVVCIMIGIVGLIIPIIPGVLFLVAAIFLMGKVSTRVKQWSDQQPLIQKIQNRLHRLQGASALNQMKVVALMSLESLVSGLAAVFSRVRALKVRGG